MKYYYQGLVKRDLYWDTEKKGFYPLNVPIYEEQMGSFCLMILDGRNSIETMKNDCFDRYHKQKNIEHLSGFRIIKSNRFIDSDQDKSKTIYEFIE
jgi:hypothetical protein